ncbi:hypothetical protein ACFLXE_00515 [Chloroflexota bacterium]
MSTNLEMAKVFTLTAFWWAEKFGEIFSLSGPLVTFWKSAIFIVPILAFGSLLLRRNKLTIWLAVFAVAFIFLGKGTNPPFSGFYPWLVFDSPVISSFGWQFRNPNRWHILLAFCYAMLISFTISAVLGWIRSRINRNQLRYGLTATAIIFFVAVPLVWGYPLLTGDVNGKMRPEPLSTDFVAFNNWLEADDSISKVMFYPETPAWGAPKPTLELSNPTRPRVFRYYWLFIDKSLLKGDTQHCGELVAPWNTKYIVVRTDLLSDEKSEKVLQALSDQEDLKQVKQFGSLHVFQNQAFSTQVHAATQSVVVQGGLETMASLTSIDSNDLANSSVIFLDQSVRSSDYLLEADILISNLDHLGLYLSSLEDDLLIKPFLATNHRDPDVCWSKGTADDLVHGEWHPQLERRGIENWEFDYDQGLVFTEASDTLEIPFKAKETGKYYLFIRYFRNEKGGSIGICLDDALIEIMNTEDQLNHFAWEKVKLLDLDKGKHTLTLINREGFNAVNIFALIPRAEYEDREKEITGLLEDKRIVYLFQAESDLYEENAERVDLSDADGAAGYALALGSDSAARLRMEILRSSDYRVALRVQGDAVIKVDGNPSAISAQDLSWVYLDPRDLSTGEHSIELSSDAMPILYQDFEVRGAWSDDFETGKIKPWISASPANLSISIDNAKAAIGQNSLKGKVAKSDSSGWRVARTDYLEIAPGQKYEFSLYLSGSDLNSAHAKVTYYDAGKSPVGEETFIARGLSGTFPFAEFSTLRTSPIQASYLRISVLARSNPDSVSYWWLDGVRIEPTAWNNRSQQKMSVSIDSGRAVVGTHSLRGDIVAEDSDNWRVVSSDLVEIEPGQAYEYSLYLAAERANSVHAKLSYYDADMELLDQGTFIKRQDGTFDFTRFGKADIAPPGARYAAIAVLAKSNPESASTWWLDEVKIEPAALVDCLTVYSTTASSETLEDVFSAKENPAEVVEYKKANPTKYTVKVSATEPFMLSFAEAYDPLWVAKVNGREIESVPLYSVVNGFWIEGTGELEITIEYKPQRWFQWGAIITLLSLAAAAFYLVYDWRRRRRPTDAYVRPSHLPRTLGSRPEVDWRRRDKEWKPRIR